MPDQEVHEIQLNGKQLVFMFMAATVVSVVIFLCGVMVGRGVRQPVVDSLAVAPGTSIDPTTPPDPSSGKPAATVEPAPERENLTYAERLEAPTPLSEPLRLTETRPAVPPAAVGKTAAEKPVPSAIAVRDPKEQPARKTANLQSTPVTKPDAVVASSRFAEPQGKGVVFQVQAFPTIDAAEALAARLKSKGYPTFVLPNPDNPRGRYRVRVGKYSNKSEAETVFRRLKQEENFKPWRIP